VAGGIRPRRDAGAVAMCESLYVKHSPTTPEGPLSSPTCDRVLTITFLEGEGRQSDLMLNFRSCGVFVNSYIS
jgi:hypothetical protein